MSDIFISYASEDRDRVQPLARALERKGWSVWWDRRIPVGRSFDEVIQEALDASKTVVVVWTTNSVKSQWVKNEAREGLHRRVLFPVMLLEEIKIPLEFRHVQAAQLTDWQPEESHSGFDQFVQDIAQIIGPSPAVKPEPPSTQTPATKPQSIASPAKTITGKDGATMLLIPGGTFWMGSPDGEGDGDEHPRHSVALSAFYLDKHQVTNRLFQQFVQQTGYRTTAEQEGKAYAMISAGKWKEVKGAHWRKPEGGETVFDSHRAEHPVVSVSWEDAHAYCRWAGKRLPTEAEFEYATRAGTNTKYWWGDGHPSSRLVANIADESLKRQYSDWPGPIMTGYDDGYIRTAPVGSFDANPFGLYDMTGNVWEWTADWYGEQYYEKSPQRNPKGPSSGEYCVLRGGSWGHRPGSVRSANRYRNTPTLRHDSVGFRCAQDCPN